MVIRTTIGSGSGFSRYEDASDEQLVALLRMGDDRALERLMQRYRGLIYQAVKSCLGSLSEAEDIFQEICLTLHQNREAYQAGSAKFSSWLYRVVVNRCLDLRKSAKSGQCHTELQDTIPDQSANAEDALHHHQIKQKLEELMAELPIQQQRALACYYGDGLEVSEIAGKLDVSELAVRSLIKRGKEKLRRSSAAEEAYFS